MQNTRIYKNTYRKKRAPALVYTSPDQLTSDYFQTPFDQTPLKLNRRIILTILILWDEICGLYLKQPGVAEKGRSAFARRLEISSTIIKPMCNPGDRETVGQIGDNKSIVDCQHHFGAYSGQIGRGGPPLSDTKVGCEIFRRA